MTQDLSNYTRAYYERDIAETHFWRNGLLRPDQLAALCYAMGWPFSGTEGLRPREPGFIVSVGAGRGELEAALEKLPGVTGVAGVDPSDGPRQMYEGSRLEPTADPALVAQAGTVIFCESIEHIPAEQSQAVIDAMSPGARLVIVNWPDYHPIWPDPLNPWDHMTLIDDVLYDGLCAGRTVVLRRGSHLVLDIP